jgi:tRNA (mo5U34)-methyltransferase
MASPLNFVGTYWHQRWEVSPGVWTPGINDVAALCEAVRLPKDLSGKRVLDIGAWNGCFSFECERRGAREVLGIGPEPSDVTGLDMLKGHLGSRVQYRLGSIYDLEPAALGHFDVVLCFGVLYHLRYPLLGLDNIRRVCRGELFLETACIDRFLLVDGAGEELAAVDSRLSGVALLQFYRGDELSNDHSNWFAPNLTALTQMMGSAGFRVGHAANWGVRAVARAQVTPGPAEFLTTGNGEAIYYELFTRKLLGDRSDLS